MRQAFATIAVLLIPLGAFAQSGASPASASAEPPTINFVTGFSVGSSEVGPLAGGSISAGVTPWLSLEGSGGYADRGPGINGVYALASAVFNILPASQRVVPFATIGGGLYHAALDMGNREMFGSMDLTPYLGPQTMMVVGTSPHGTGMVTVSRPAQMPMAYANRMGAITMPQNGQWNHRSFTDPAMSVGGGVAIRLSRNVVLRPDARALMIFSGGDTQAIGLMNVGVGFRF